MNRIGIKALAACVIFAVLLCGCALSGAAAEVNAAAVIDPAAGIVTVTGTHPMGENMRVTLTVKNGENIFFRRETAAGEGGRFSFAFAMNAGTEAEIGDESGLYKIIIGGAGLSPVEKEIRFINAADGSSFVKAANAASNAEEMKKAVEAYADGCGIDLSEQSLFCALSEKSRTAIYAAMARKNDYANAMEIAGIFDTDTVICTLNEADKKDAAALIAKYGEYLPFDMSAKSSFAKIKTDAAKTKIYEAVTAENLPLNDTEKLTKIFESAVYTQLFNELSTENRDMFTVYAEECSKAGLCNISMTDYSSSKLTDKDRADIITDALSAAKSKPFESLSDVKSTFETLAANKLKSASDSSGSKSSGGGGGSRVTVGGGKAPSPSIAPDNGEKTNRFSDLAAAPWAADAINYLAEKNIVNGVGNGCFNPMGEIRREEFVKLIVLALKLPGEDTEKRFSDVSEDAWYYECVTNAYALNIVKGVDFDIFGVGQSITREQMCAIIYRAMKLMDISIDDNENEMSFSDNGEISEYAYRAVEALYRGGVINGVGDNRFDPKGTATRAMASKMIYQLMIGGSAA